MMATLKSNRLGVLQRMREVATHKLDRVGIQGRTEARAATRRATGFAAESVHYVVVDDDGSKLAGDDVDGNLNPVPSYPGDGTIRLHIGSNTAPRTGQGYYIFLERGVGGRPGDATMARTLDIVEALAEQELGR